MRKIVKRIACSLLSVFLCSFLFSGCDFSTPTESALQSIQQSSESVSSEGEEMAVRYWRDTRNFGIRVQDGVMKLGEEVLYKAGN